MAIQPSTARIGVREPSARRVVGTSSHTTAVMNTTIVPTFGQMAICW